MYAVHANSMVQICLRVVEERAVLSTSQHVQALVPRAWIELVVTDVDTILGVMEFDAKKNRFAANWQMKDGCGADRNEWINRQWA